MTESQKQAILNKAHNVRSEKEMHDFVASLAGCMHSLEDVHIPQCH